MALFRISRGLQENLGNKDIIDGQILICIDTGNIYIDSVEGEKIERIKLNPRILSGPTEPNDEDGDVGDIYIQLPEGD